MVHKRSKVTFFFQVSRQNFQIVNTLMGRLNCLKRLKKNRIFSQGENVEAKHVCLIRSKPTIYLSQLRNAVND